jgi:hypothetical protein
MKMSRSSLFLGFVAVVAPSALALGQEQTVAPIGPSTEGPYRRLAPGVLRQVVPPVEFRETYSRHDLVELLAANPNLDYARNVWFRRTVWYLDFQFKDVRMCVVDLPRADGKLEQKLVWYMVYTVTNPGGAIRAVERPDGTFAAERTDVPVLFTPEFYFEATDLGKVYPERVIPAAVAKIIVREDPNRRLLNSAEIAREIQVGETLWGVVTWTDIDSETDFFSIYVGGLTNAYEWEDPPGASQKGDPPGTGRKFTRKYLKINFWRPGDEFIMPYQTALRLEKEIRFGQPAKPDYEWVYRPFPFLQSQ